MTNDLYQKNLLRLAAAATGAGRLEAPDATVTVDNPLCGDRVTIDINLREGKLTELAHTVRGCVMCQASAAVLGARAAGHTPEQLHRIKQAVQNMLNKEENLAGHWSELESFLPVAGHKSRYNCVLLPFKALTQAAEEASCSS